MKRFYPDEYLEKVMPGGIAKNGLLYDNLSIKQRYMRALYKAAGKEGKALKETISKTIEFYAQKEEKMGAQTLLTRRIENFLVWNKVQEEKEAHQGEFYRWMPSDAQNPDPEHQLLYGKIFRVGEGDKDGNMPGERYGCRCGIEWLTDAEAFKEFAGKEFTGYKGQNAINKIIKEKQGHVLNAIESKKHGVFSIFWGNERGGLLHAMLRRQKKGYGIDFFNDMATVIKEGERFPNKYSSDKYDLWHKKKQKLVIISKKFGNKKIQWPISMMKQKRRPTR